ncbi:hypothetical protein BP5796_07200 [Coleophoma crateriformis]|uniref:Mtf2-like C-terminal domain-containing protein n=1 Tax=Coleophoma crateriformis TaxID=565419 RepID=A0A3D8RIK0_9HELO|nr:hypothetical protein BP5796_07200 [Coleophoma crateriformis]
MAQKPLEAVPAAISSISTTLMPFLYQTRTLSSSRFLGPVAPRGNRVAGVSYYRYLHSCSRQSEEETGPRISRIPYTPRNPFRDESAPTSRRKPRTSRSADGGFVINRITTGSGHQASAPFDTDIPFDYPEKGDWAGVHDMKEIGDLTRISREESKAQGTTITPSERRAFQNIFTNIINRKLPKFKLDPVLPDDPLSESLPSSTASLHKIMSGAPKRPQPPQKTRAEIEAAVQKFPPSLREAAAKAMGLEDTVQEVEQKVEFVDPLDSRREPERARVEALMRGAKSDFELWAILEKEVFSLVDKLNLREAEVEEVLPLKKSKKNGRKPGRNPKVVRGEKLEEVVTAGEEEQTSETNEEEAYQLHLLGPLYPSYLLLGLRLLDRDFAKPSPLTLSILPKIKSLGIMSHVLGASTALYNELLRINSNRYDNYSGAIQLLAEMEAAGLDHDAETLRIVNDICETQEGVREGEKGRTLQVLWTMPEFAPKEFLMWREKIQRALSESKYLASQAADF